MENSKYKSLLLWLLLLVVVVVVVSLDVASLAILTIDAAMVGGAGLIFKPEITKKMNEIEHGNIFGNESPIDWLFISTRFFSISLFASIGSLLMELLSLTIADTATFSIWLFGGAVLFCIMGFVFIIRIWEFLRNPVSKVNVLVGKIINWAAEGGIRLSFIILMTMVQAFNAILAAILLEDFFVTSVIKVWAIIYVGCVIFSFGGMIRCIYSVIARFRKIMNKWDKIFVIALGTPWIVLYIHIILTKIGIVVP